MSNRTLPAPGNYAARLNGQMVVEETEGGALIVWLPYALCSPDVQWTGKHCVCIGTKDGVVQQKTIATLKKIFSEWDNDDVFALEAVAPNETNEPQFELAQCFHDNSYTPADATEPVIQFKAMWLNVLGGSQNMPAPLDDKGRKKVLTTWGGKIRATIGGTSAKPAAAKPAQAAAAKTAAPAAAAPKVAGPPSRGKAPAAAKAPRSLNQDQVWDMLEKANPGVSQADLGEKYYAAQDAVRPDANSEFTPEEWGLIADALGV